LFLGFYPKPVLDRLEPTVKALVTQVQQNSNYTPPAVSNDGPAVAQGSGK